MTPIVLLILVVMWVAVLLPPYLRNRGGSGSGASMTSFRDPGLFSLYAFLAPDYTHAQVESALRETIAILRKDGVTEDELARAKSVMHAHEAFGRDGPFAVASHLNEAIAAGDWKLYTSYMERVNQVTTEDVHRVAQTYLIDDRCTVGYYVPEAGESGD